MNLLFAALHPLHADHARARAWLDNRADSGSLKICRLVQMGALRLLTSPAVMGVDRLTPKMAWLGYRRLVEDARFVFTDEPVGLDEAWQRLTDVPKGIVKIDTDTYLAGEFTVATFDKGFARFEGLSTDILA